MENRKLKKSEIAIAIVAIFIIFMFAFSYIMYKRSVRATISEYIISLAIKEVTEEEAIEELENRRISGDVKYQLDYKFDYPIEEKEEYGMQVYYLNEQEKPKNTIIYLHGGAYVNQPNKYHWKFLNKLANNTAAEIVIPLYPLAPNHTYLEAYDVVTKLYKDYIQNHPDTNIILMGDSAGGGLALGLSLYFSEQSISQPERLILISPWVDISMTNSRIEDFVAVDPMLQLAQLNVYADSWSGGEDLKHWQLSPIYGDLSKLENVTIFVGTREIFYPDCKLLADKLEELEVACELNVGTGLNHDYLLFPISEANKEITIIKKTIKNIEDKNN